jgi:hypothetical protein
MGLCEYVQGRAQYEAKLFSWIPIIFDKKKFIYTQVFFKYMQEKQKTNNLIV